MSLVGGPALLPAWRRGRSRDERRRASFRGSHPWSSLLGPGSAGILGRGRSGRFLVVRGSPPRGDLDRLGGLRGRLPGVLGGDGAIGLRLLLADHPELVPRGPEEDQLLALLVAVVLGGGEQEGAQASLLLRPAADDGDLARLEHEVRRQVAEGLLLLAVVDPELLGGVRRGMGQGLVGSLDRAVMDLGGEPQRDAVAALVRRRSRGSSRWRPGNPCRKAGSRGSGGGSTCSTGSQVLISVCSPSSSSEGRRLDLVRRRGVEDRLQLGGKLAGDLADPQAVDLQRPPRLGGDGLFVGDLPYGLVDRRVPEGAIEDRHAQHALLGLDDLPGLAADPAEEALGAELVLVRIAARQARQADIKATEDAVRPAVTHNRLCELMERSPFRVISTGACPETLGRDRIPGPMSRPPRGGSPDAAGFAEDSEREV